MLVLMVELEDLKESKMAKEHYHTLEEYRKKGLEPFVEHALDYLRGKRTLPISKTISFASKQVLFTFSSSLLLYFDSDVQSIKKPYDVAIKYGYRGNSNGGINGIFNQRKEDTRLKRRTESLALEHEDEISENLCLGKEGLDSLRKVKIVWHKPNGERIVGLYNNENNIIIFLGFAKY